jgi:hypothetical protein
MKKILFTLLSFTVLLSATIVRSQTFINAKHDTLYVTATNTVVSVDNNIVNISGDTITVNWHVLASNFPNDWLTMPALGICDNNTCRNNSGGASSGVLWNTGGAGTTYSCLYPGTSSHSDTGLFEGQFNLSSATTSGTYYMTVSLQDPATGGTNKTITFMVTKAPVAVRNVMVTANDVALYPNPANNEVNVLFDANADVKTIAVYNIIGKAMNVYRVTANNSANLNIENIPAGIYFVRLMNAQGGIVATKKFTKQ